MTDDRSRRSRRIVSAEKARQGEIVLRTPLRRGLFIAGLIGAIILAVAVAIWSSG